MELTNLLLEMTKDGYSVTFSNDDFLPGLAISIMKKINGTPFQHKCAVSTDICGETSILMYEILTREILQGKKCLDIFIEAFPRTNQL